MIHFRKARRWRRSPTASSAGGHELQCRLLDVVLESHPVPLAFAALAVTLTDESDEMALTIAIATAVRDLVAAGLLASDGLCVFPTRAALHYRLLERER